MKTHTTTSSSTSLPAIFVLHVAADTARAAHIDGMMARMDLPFEYILAGDKADLSRSVLTEYFGGPMARVSGATSCAYKHLLACREILERGLPGALVLEDDAILFKKFPALLGSALAELEAKDPSRAALISFEDTRLRFVPRSERCRGRVLYPGDRDRFAGIYYINAAAARLILDRSRDEKMSMPIDIFHCCLLERGLLDYWWTHPCGATQGSHNGAFASALSHDRAAAIVWRLRRGYRKLLYWLR